MYETVKKFKDLKILVIGDIMLDRFIWGEVDRISPEAPVPVVKVTKENYTLGGAANVLNNIISLGAEAYICGVIGDDFFSNSIMQLVSVSGASTEGIVIEPHRTTIVKTRVIGQKQQIVRVDREENKTIQNKSIKALLRFVEDNIKKFDAVILSDYGKGLINTRFYNALQRIVSEHNKILNIDPKNANMNIYKRATLLTPNLHEASFACNMKITMNNLQNAGKKLLKKFISDYLVITLGDKGMAIFSKENNGFIHIPTVAKDVYDVTGAGDTVISVITMAMALGVDVEKSARLANIAAGIVVGKMGTATVSIDELLSNIDSCNV